MTIIKKLAIGASTLLFGFTMLAANAGPQWFANSFLNGSALLLYGATTNNFADTGVPYVSGQYSNLVFSSTSSNMVPTLVASTSSVVVNGVTNSVTTYTYYWTNTAAYSSASPTAGGVMTNSALGYPYAFKDNDLWCNPDGSAGSASIVLAAHGSVAGNTNHVSVLLTRGGGPILGTTPGKWDNVFWGTGSQDQFIFGLTLAGTAEKVVVTNLPTAFLQGAGQIHCTYVGTDGYGSSFSLLNTTTSTNTFVDYLAIVGYRP